MYLLLIIIIFNIFLLWLYKSFYFLLCLSIKFGFDFVRDFMYLLMF